MSASIDPLLKAGVSSEIGAEVFFNSPKDASTVDFAAYADIVHFPCNLLKAVPQAMANVPVEFFVKTLTGKTIPIRCLLSDSIERVKGLIFRAEGHPSAQQKLLFHGQHCGDDDSVFACGIQSGSTVHLIIKLVPEGGFRLHFPMDFLSPSFDYKFPEKDDKSYERGKFKYERPCGFMRFAINVKHRYPGDEAWLGTNAAAWPVSYHGTSPTFLEHVQRQLGGGQSGLPSTPSPSVAYAHARSFVYNGKSFRLIFQHRVDPAHLKIVKGTDGADIWLVAAQDHMRPYGICIREDKNEILVQIESAPKPAQSQVPKGAAAASAAPAPIPATSVPARNPVTGAPPSATPAAAAPTQRHPAPRPAAAAKAKTTLGKVDGIGAVALETTADPNVVRFEVTLPDGTKSYKSVKLSDLLANAGPAP